MDCFASLAMTTCPATEPGAIVPYIILCDTFLVTV
jgi:hypothetical protein